MQGWNKGIFWSIALLGGLLTGVVSYAAPPSTSPSAGTSASALPSSPSEILPQDITPEGVLALLQSGTVPVELINLDKPNSLREPDGMARRIYYSNGVSVRAAKNAVLQDRQKLSAQRSGNSPQLSQRLTGTPLDWKQLDLPVGHEAVPQKPLLISPKALSEALKDGVDLQIIDLRPPSIPPPAETPMSSASKPKASATSPSAPTPFPQALTVMPHQIEAILPELSQKRWLVLIDDGHLTAQMLAEQLMGKGFQLIGVLDGGYPAWVAATDR